MHHCKFWLRWLIALTLTHFLVSCATTGRQVSGWGTITVAPGDTGTCMSIPCRILFEMPPGDGSYRVTISHIDVGEFPAGKTVSLGGFFESKAIRVVGSDLPPAYIYVPEGASDIQ